MYLYPPLLRNAQNSKTTAARSASRVRFMNFNEISSPRWKLLRVSSRLADPSRVPAAAAAALFLPPAPLSLSLVLLSAAPLFPPLMCVHRRCISRTHHRCSMHTVSPRKWRAHCTLPQKQEVDPSKERLPTRCTNRRRVHPGISTMQRTVAY